MKVLVNYDAEMRVGAEGYQPVQLAIRPHLNPGRVFTAPIRLKRAQR